MSEDVARENGGRRRLETRTEEELIDSFDQRVRRKL